MQDPTDYADTVATLSDFAEGLELEVSHGNPTDTDRLHKASLLLRRTIALLQPLAETDPDEDTAIELREVWIDLIEDVYGSKEPPQ